MHAEDAAASEMRGLAEPSPTLRPVTTTAKDPIRTQTGAGMTPLMGAATIVLTLFASLAAGLLPAWRACQVTPAMQLKSQ